MLRNVVQNVNNTFGGPFGTRIYLGIRIKSAQRLLKLHLGIDRY